MGGSGKEAVANPSFRHPLQVEFIVAEAFDVAGEVGAQEANVGHVDLDPFLHHGAQGLHHVRRVLQNHGRGDQVVVAQALLLFVGVVFGQHVTAEREPFGKAIVGLDLVGSGGDLLAEFAAANPFEQERHAHDLAEFLRRQKQAVAAAFRAEPAQQKRRGDCPGLDRQRYLHQVLQATDELIAELARYRRGHALPPTPQPGRRVHRCCR